MNSALMARASAIIALTPAADYKEAVGKLVDIAGDTATLSSSATTPAKGIILDGNTTTAGYATETVTVGILGALAGMVHMRAGGTIARGALVCQHTDATVITDAGSGARVAVGIANQAAVEGENFEVAPITPRIYAS